jgi:GT2 family glycosyltransferase
MTDEQEHVTVVVLAYGNEPLLRNCVEGVLGSEGVSVDLVLVDNGCLNPDLGELSCLAGVTLLRPERNLGFAAGANLGARHAQGDYIAFVNSDAVVQPDALSWLVKALHDRGVGLVTGSIRLMSQPDLLNSGGNPVHYTGISWAGGIGLSAKDFTTAREVAGASGAAMACRREYWHLLGGFCEEMFAYHEDTDISLRCWQRGWRVVFVPAAVVLHDYEFSRTPAKFGLLERNRLIMVLTLYEKRTLLILAPALVALEVALFALACRQGWWRQKVAGWVWLVGHRRWLRQRRAAVQAQRTVPDLVLLARTTSAFDPGQQLGPTTQRLATIGSRAYWLVARRLLGVSSA